MTTIEKVQAIKKQYPGMYLEVDNRRLELNAYPQNKEQSAFLESIGFGVFPARSYISIKRDEISILDTPVYSALSDEEREDKDEAKASKNYPGQWSRRDDDTGLVGID